MKSSSPDTNMASNKMSSGPLFQPRLWSIRWKIRSVFFISMLLAICILMLIAGMLQVNQAKKESVNSMILLANAKSQLINNHFSHLQDLFLEFASDRQTADALSNLSESFLNIENDDYYTSSASDQEKVNSRLENYYKTDIIPQLNTISGKAVNLQTILPDDEKQKILQSLYLASNDKPQGSRFTLNKADDASAYSNLHEQYHPEMIAFARKAGINDILLVDYSSGYVVYSMQKNLDFATNLYDGPYKNSAMAMAFKSTIGQSGKSVLTFADLTGYLPAYFNPVMFISAPVYVGSQLKGAVIFSLTTQDIDKLVSISKEGISQAGSLKCLIIGSDYTYRNDDPDYLINPDHYIKKLKRHATSPQTYLEVERIHSTSLIQSIDPEVITGEGGDRNLAAGYTSETGERVLGISVPLQVDQLNWTLVSQINKEDVLAPARRIAWLILLLGLLVTVLLYIPVHLFIQNLSKRMESVKDNLNRFMTGEQLSDSETNAEDEIGSSLKTIRLIANRQQEASAFINELGEGNTGVDIEILGDEDKYGTTLNNLKNKLKLRMEEEQKRMEQDEIRNWSAHGVALFNDILRSDTDNLQKLAFNIIKNIIEYMGANQGGLFLLEDDDGHKYLKLEAAYAYNRQKFLTKTIEVGEGLVGMCVLEKKTTLLSRIPADYIEITSGLGSANPGCLLIVPLKKEDEVLGVIEIASFEKFKPHEVEFAEKIAESIAAALITVRLHLQTSQYLERFQQQAEEMKAQEEELRQNIEELQATHEQIERLKQEEVVKSEQALKNLEDYRQLLLNILDQIPDKVFLKDHDGKLLFLNSAVSKLYGKTVNEMIGTTDFDNHSPEEAKEYREKELEVMAKGTETFIQEETLSGELRLLKTTKMPFFVPHLGKTGLLGFQIDVTELNNLEEKVKQLKAEIKELRRNEE